MSLRLWGLLTLMCSLFGLAVGKELFLYSDLSEEKRASGYNVSYDERSLLVDGQRVLLLGGSIHYPRAPTYQWDALLDAAVADGLNHIQIYIFWNLHDWDFDPSANLPHKYNFEGRANVALFLQKCAEHGLFVDFRVGPYACAEWDFGGLPLWTLHVEDMVYRSDNSAWKRHMGVFVRKMMQVAEPFLARNGGPIILAQIENELHNAPQSYIDWCGDLAQSLDVDVPWIMCNGQSADNTINTCNGNDCFGYAHAHSERFPTEPLLWTENEGWFQYWAYAYDADTNNWANRAPQDVAYAVALWFAAGGCHHNYYMWFGGNHLSHWAGSGIANLYADGANLHADGLPNEPKKSHLQKLHKLMAAKQHILLSDEIQVHNAVPLIDGADSEQFAYLDSCDLSMTNVYQLWTYHPKNGQISYTDYDDVDFCLQTTSSFPIVIEKCAADGSANQGWVATKVVVDGTDLYVIQSKADSELCLEAKETGTLSVQIGDCKPPTDPTRISQLFMFYCITPGDPVEMVPVGHIGWCVAAGKTQVADAYEYKDKDTGESLDFLVNSGLDDVSVRWKKRTYDMRNKSVLILDTDGRELYNSGEVSKVGIATERVYEELVSGSSLTFFSWTEPFPLSAAGKAPKIQRTDKSTFNKTPLEQIRFGNEKSEYLIYSTPLPSLSKVKTVSLSFVGRAANAYMVFVNDTLVAEAFNYDHGAGQRTHSDLRIKYPFVGSENYVLTIVSSALGMDNFDGIQSGATPQTVDRKGIDGDVTWTITTSTGSYPYQLKNHGWVHFVGLTGENLKAYDPWASDSSINWRSPRRTNRALTWYSTKFSLSSSLSDLQLPPILLDIGANSKGMNRGHFFVNGVDVGHYNAVSYGNMVQRYYFLPRDVLNFGSSVNHLRFCEELPGVVPENIRIVTTTMVIPTPQ